MGPPGPDLFTLGSPLKFFDFVTDTSSHISCRTDGVNIKSTPLTPGPSKTTPPVLSLEKSGVTLPALTVDVPGRGESVSP